MVLRHKNEAFEKDYLLPEQLDYIIRQVRADGYHVELISNFAINQMDTGAIIDALYEWVAQAGLKLSINHRRGICFFEIRN